MSLSKPRALAALCLLALAACGFHPLYAQRSPLGYDPALAAIQVQPAKDRIGQILTAALREQLNPSGANLKPHYVLTLDLAIARSDLGFQRDNTSTRGELTFTVHLKLSRPGSDDVAYADSVRTVTAFNLPFDAYAATIAEQNAREEAANEIGLEIAERLTVFLHRQAGLTP